MTYCFVVAVPALVGSTKKPFGHYAILKILSLRSPNSNFVAIPKSRSGPISAHAFNKFQQDQQVSVTYYKSCSEVNVDTKALAKFANVACQTLLFVSVSLAKDSNVMAD